MTIVGSILVLLQPESGIFRPLYLMKTMKKLILLTISLIAAISCSENAMHFIGGDISLDKEAHDIMVNSDLSITQLSATSYIGDIKEGHKAGFTDGSETITCNGQWFTLTVKKGSAKNLNVRLTANDTGKERRLEITAKHLCFEPANITIIQKAD